jgi:hypothetical protein
VATAHVESPPYLCWPSTDDNAARRRLDNAQ